MPTEPGIYPDLPRADYDAIDAANFSTIKYMDQSAAHYKQNLKLPKEPTGAMVFGCASHTVILEPEAKLEDYAVGPLLDGEGRRLARRSTIAKGKWAEYESSHADKSVIDSLDDWNSLKAMFHAIHGNPVNSGVSAWLKTPGKYELTIVWVDEATGILCKGRIDKYGRSPDGYVVASDLKTTKDARPRPFGSQVYNMHYDAQAAMYHDGLQVLAPIEYRASALIALEKVPPLCAAIYELGEAELDCGRDKYRRWLNLLQRAREKNEWPGYVQEPQALQLPKWAYPMEAV